MGDKDYTQALQLLTTSVITLGSLLEESRVRISALETFLVTEDPPVAARYKEFVERELKDPTNRDFIRELENLSKQLR
jgi:hypothetical protein